MKARDLAATSRLFDAHNHLQDERLVPHVARELERAQAAGIRRMVVNGTCERDWPRVKELATQFPIVLPSYGLHPWRIEERSDQWQNRLSQLLVSNAAGIGEIGIDGWFDKANLPEQEEVFLWQLNLAARLNRPASIHCLKAWGRLLELLRAHSLPRCGFLLHSYGGPKEMIPALAELGAYFSLPGYFAHERKVRQRDAFRFVPASRLLIETDSPDQLLPEDRDSRLLKEQPSGQRINAPTNLAEVYQLACDIREESMERLMYEVEENFHRLFGPVIA